MAEKRLGTGLGALFGDAALESSSSDFDFLPISKVEPRQNQPRNLFSPEGLEELAASIREHGIIQPLTVRRLEGGFFQIIAGERRWRAARLAGLSQVPARIIEADERGATEMALVENLQREDLNAVEEAKGYRALMTDYGLTQEEIAKRVSKSRPVIANALRLLSLPQDLIKMIETSRLSPGLARAILSIEGDEQRVAAAEVMISKNMTVREAEAYVKKLQRSQMQSRKQRAESREAQYIEDIERRLTSNLGRKVKIVYGKRKGRFEIEYYNPEDFEALLAAIEALRPVEGENIR